MIKYKQLETKLSKGNYFLTQIWREGDYAIFEQKRKDNGRVCAYEAIRINKHNGYTLGGNVIEPAETYPGASMFGIDGFTYQTLTKAEEKIKEMSGQNINDVVESGIENNKQQKIESKNKNMETLTNTETVTDTVTPASITDATGTIVVGGTTVDAPKNIVINNLSAPKTRGRKPKLKGCTKCNAQIYTSVFQKNGGLCPTCKAEKV